MGNWLKKFEGPLVTVVLPAITLALLSALTALFIFSGRAEASAFIQNDPAVQELQKSMDTLRHDHAAMDKSIENTEFELETLVRASAEIAKAQQTAATQQQLAALQLTALAEQVRSLNTLEIIDRQGSLDRDNRLQDRLDTLRSAK